MTSTHPRDLSKSDAGIDTLPPMSASKVKTSEIKGLALDWAVAKANKVFAPEGFYAGFRAIDGKLHLISDSRDVFNDPYCPSTNWSQGGPIIEREKIDLIYSYGDEWGAYGNEPYIDERVTASGPTPLIAAMRCFVASKLGDVVDVPEELV